MRMSKMHMKTLREVPNEAEISSHILLLRTGMIRKLVSGVYGFMPLGWRSVRKIEEIIRQEMDATGAQEIHMSAIQPAEQTAHAGCKQRESAGSQCENAAVCHKTRFIVKKVKHLNAAQNGRQQRADPRNPKRVFCFHRYKIPSLSARYMSHFMRWAYCTTFRAIRKHQSFRAPKNFIFMPDIS